MLFTFDCNKSLRNLEKHGIDFREAQALWSDDNRLEFKLMHTGEQRYGVLALQHGLGCLSDEDCSFASFLSDAQPSGRGVYMTAKMPSASDIDRMVDEGVDMTPYIDMSSIEQPGRNQRRVGIDMVETMISRLDFYAAQYGVTRQSLMKLWLGERLDQEDDRRLRSGKLA